MFSALILPILLYNCGLWALTQQLSNRLDAWHRRKLRYLLGVVYPHHMSNAKVYASTRQGPVSTTCRRRRLLWLGHVVTLPSNSQLTKLYFGSVYRPPSLTHRQTDNFFTQFQSILQRLSVSMPDSMLLASGDFNARCSEWYGSTTDSVGHQLLCLLQMLSLSQLVTFPTHYSQHSGHASALDLVITNHPLLFSNLSTAAPLGTSDHDIVLARLQLQGQQDTRSVAIPDEPSQLNFSSFDTSLRACEEWSLVGQCLSTIDWFNELQIPLGNPSHSVDLLNHILMNTISSCVPMRRIRQPSNRPQLFQPPWLTPALRAQIKRKRDAFSLYKKFPTPANLARYKTERNNTRNLSRSEHRAYANSLTLYSQGTTPTSQPTLHTFIRSLRSPPSQRQPTKQLTVQDETFTSPSDIANVFNKQFVAFGTSNNPEWTILPIADADSTSFFSDIRTTPTSVAKYIKRLKLRKAAGLDGITNELLKILGPSICDPLSSFIFNLSFSSGVFPSVWKRSVVVPIYKNKGSKSDPTNYRPISLLSAISKLRERVMYDQLYAHVNPLLSPAQSGLRKGDSTAWQLARFTQNLLERRHQHKSA